MERERTRLKRGVILFRRVGANLYMRSIQTAHLLPSQFQISPPLDRSLFETIGTEGEMSTVLQDER